MFRSLFQSQTRLIIFLSASFSVLLLVLVGALIISNYRGQRSAPAASTAGFVPVDQGLVRSEEEAALEVWVEDISRFYALDMEIRFDPNALQVIDADPDKEGVQIQPGQAPAPDFVATNSVDQEQGSIQYVVTQLAPREGFSGSGLVGRIAWQGTFDQDETITFETAILVDDSGQPIEATLQNLADQKGTTSLVQK